ESIGKEVDAFSVRQVKLTDQFEVLKLKHQPAQIKAEIKETEGNIVKLKDEIKVHGETPELKTQLSALEEKLGKSKAIDRELTSFDKVIKSTDEVRLRDFIKSTSTTFGPPYKDPVARQVNDLLESNPELKKVFSSPEAVNSAIRKFPSELKPEELQGLKQIRESFHKIPAEGLPVVKVYFPGIENVPLEKFVVQAEHLKDVKTPQDLIDLLQLDYPKSPFVKDGVPNFKLDDIQVTTGRVFSDEAKIPFNSDFVSGGRNGIIYQYPFSGSGFTTPQTGFPKPEIELKSPLMGDNVKTVKWKEFAETDVETLAPKRVNPNPIVQTSNPEIRAESPDARINSENLEAKTNPEVRETRSVNTANLSSIESRLDNLPIDDKTKSLIKNLAESPEVKANPNVLENILDSFEKAGTNSDKLAIRTQLLEGNVNEVISKFKSSEANSMIESLTEKLLPVFKKMGIPVTEAIGKIVKGLGKALPVIGAAASGYDTVRMGKIALTGFDPSGKDYTKYPDGDVRNTPENLDRLKDVRALALVGSIANGADTVLGILEATGVGNIDFPIQLGLAGAEIVLDLAVEYFREHPDKMPKELSLAIKAASLIIPGSSQIYGADGLIDNASTVTKAVGEAVISEVREANEASVQDLDKSLGSVAKDLNTIADVIRNPEKYAAMLGKKVEEVVSEAVDLVKNFANGAGSAATKAANLLVDVASNPTKYTKLVSDKALQVGKDIYKGSAKAVDFASKLVEKGLMNVEQGVKYLGTAGIKFLKDGMALTGRGATKFKEFATDLYNNPAKYGNLAVNFMNNMKESIIDGSKSAFNFVKGLAQTGVASAKQAINTSIEALAKAGKLTVEYAKYFVDHPFEASQELLQSAKNVLVSAAQKGDEVLGYLKDLQDRVGGALGRFEDTLVSLAKQGGEVLSEIISKHYNVIKNRLPEILNAGANIANAVGEQLKKILPVNQLVSVLSATKAGFGALINLTSKYKDVANQFMANAKAEFSAAWNKGTSSLVASIEKYYDKAVAMGGAVLEKAKAMLYNVIQSIDNSIAGGWVIPDWTYSKLKP
ncbi:MAG: hypothetical protein AABZ74_18025, partial [Cyanobacteriota bacterium]